MDQLKWSKVPRRRINKLRTMFELINEETENKFYKILEDIYIHEYREVMEIYELIPPSQWDMYYRLDVDLREMKLLKHARNNLRAAFMLKVLNHVKEKKAGQKIIAEDDE
jgi:hypothetical protein